MTVGRSDLRADIATEPAATAPVWFDYLLLAVVSGVLGIGGVGLLLADVGHYSALLSIPIGAVLAVGFVLLARPALRRAGDSPPRALGNTLAVVGTCVVAAGQALWNFAFAGHHVVTDRDPGIYTVTARWLTGHPSLVVSDATQWAHLGLSNLALGSGGLFPQPNGTLLFQFAHMLPVLMAQGYALGGNALMFRVPALLGAISLCVVYRVACEVIRRPLIALTAVVALAVSLPELAFTRDSFTEPLQQLLIWSGIWLLLQAYRRWSPDCGFVAGLFIGATLMAHVDAIAYLVPLPALGALAWLVDRGRVGSVRVLKLLGAVLVGAVLAAALGYFDLRYRSPGYYSDLHHQVHGLYLALGAVTVLSLLAAVASPLSRSIGRLLAHHEPRLLTAAGWIIVGGLTGAWILRPVGPKATQLPASPIVAALQRSNGLPFSPTRTYAEATMRWFQWYLGPITVALGIGGIALMVVRAVRTRLVAALVILVFTLPLTVFYLWKPSVVPDQIWASRRFVPIGFPLFVLAGGYALDQLLVIIEERRLGARLRRAGLVLGTAAMVVFPLAGTLPVRSFRPQANYLPALESICKRIGPNAQVLFPFDQAGASWNLLAQSLRSFCGVPVALLRPPGDSVALVNQAAKTLAAKGKTLWLLSDIPSDLEPFATGTRTPELIVNAMSTHEIAETLTSPPQHYATTALVVYSLDFS